MQEERHTAASSPAGSLEATHLQHNSTNRKRPIHQILSAEDLISTSNTMQIHQDNLRASLKAGCTAHLQTGDCQETNLKQSCKSELRYSVGKVKKDFFLLVFEGPFVQVYTARFWQLGS